MSNPTTARMWGIAGWLILVTTGGAMYPHWWSTNPTDSPITQRMFGSPQELTARDPLHRLQPNDPIFYRVEDRWVQAGYVRDVQDDQVQLAWYIDGVSPHDLRWSSHRSTGSLQEVVATMLPEHKRDEIRQKLETLLQQQGQKLSQSLAPLVRQSVLESIPELELGIRQSIANHRDEWGRLVQRLEADILQQRLLPLAKTQVFPIVRRHGQPVAETIGRELWDRASLWRFGWRALYDKTPLPRRDLLQEEWQRFVDDEAVPVFESHFDEIARAIQFTLRDVIRDAEVRNELIRVVTQIVDDREAQQLFKIILREAVLENEPLKRRWNNIWASEQARIALRETGNKIEPVIRQIGDELFGTPEKGIDPNFARVLRNQILRKDRRWMVAELSPDGTEQSGLPTIVPGNPGELFPVIYLATPNQDSGGASR